MRLLRFWASRRMRQRHHTIGGRTDQHSDVYQQQTKLCPKESFFTHKKNYCHDEAEAKTKDLELFEAPFC
jgi:hypothetical protein